MATVLTPRIKTTITGTKVKTSDKEVAPVTLNAVLDYAFTNGTGNDQVDLMYSDSVTLTTAANTEIDLAGVIADASFGDVLTFATIKAIMIVSTLDANKVLTVGGAASNAFESWVTAAGDSLKIMPGGALVLIAPNTGYAVTAGTGDLLKVTNASGGSSTFDIYVFGTSA
jgi:hypothetical protein